MTPQELKNSILQLAIQGKLVEQHPEEGTGEDLYKQIQAEKTQLIKEGKIKKEKTLSEIAEDEIPFELPEGWIWVRYSDLFDIGSAIRIHQSDWKTEGIPFFRGRELVRLAKTGDPDAEIFISQDLYEKNKEKGGVPQKGDLLVTAVGTLGKVYIVKGTKPFYYKDAYILRYNNLFGLNSDYFKYVIESPLIQDYIAHGSMGTTVAQLTIEKAKRMLCPLPPLAEQKRIVAKIEELLPLIDRYEQAYNKLEAFNKRFPDDMQKSILQMAIQGKLVPQDPSEGTGEELYKQIQAEKAKLIKEGKIKKEKPLPEITEDEIPFEIPESWRWCYVGDLFQHNTGKALNGSDRNGTLLTYITTSNLYWDRFELDKLKEMHFTDAEVDKCTVQKGDLLVCEGGDFGRAAIWPYDYPMRIQNHIHRLRAYGQISVRYFYYAFYLYKNTGMISGKGIAIQGLSANALHNLLMPLPPLAEQKRIVTKIEELLPLCERLK